MTEMEKALAAITEASVQVDSLSQPVHASPMPPMAQPLHSQGETISFQSKRPQTLADQIQQLTRIERQIDDRLRIEDVEARITAERKITDANAHYARGIAEETARLKRERDEMVRQATDEYHKKIHDLAELVRRRP